MSSPILDEQVILDILEQTPDEKQHQAGALMMLVDAYDRKVTRDQFIAAASAAVTCTDNIGRHSTMLSVKKFLIAGSYDVSPADVETALAKTSEQLKNSTGDCLKMARLLAQCPLNEDPVH